MSLLDCNNPFKLKITKKSMSLVNILCIISLIILNVLLSITGTAKWMALNIIVDSLLVFILILKKNFLQDKLKCKSRVLGLMALLFTIVSDIYFVSTFYQYRYDRFVKISEKLNISLEQILTVGKIGVSILGIIAFPALIILWNYVFNKYSDSLKKFFLNFDKIEKNFIIVTGLIFSVVVTIIYLKTNAFYIPIFHNKFILSDVVYTSDSGILNRLNVFINIGSSQNDLRQPLFGLYALPFGIVAAILSKIFFFIPNSYSIAIAIIQFIALDIAIICVAKMLGLKNIEKLSFLIVNMISYPFLLNSLNLEQYTLASFWMILFVYVVIEDKEYKEILYIGATGSLLTSGVYFVLLSKSRQLKQYIKDIAAVAIKFFIIVIMAARLPAFLEFSDSFEVYGRFFGEKLTFFDKLLQYINFISLCLVKPNSYIGTSFDGEEHISYILAEVTDINLLGIIILIVCVLGFILNYKNKYAKMCIMWALFSFVLLCIAGWGTSENGLVLYSLYFSWAFISLIYMFINKIFEKLPKVRIICQYALILVLALVNIPGILDLINFGIKYYPTYI